ncbi:hypothetical protein SDC9_169886 [bioreactor metagenome]|uniref:Uncharacterized protein n=1 Tax=bioreactor metagenome TaxID=1076179 RepID=A0A645GFE6_9ZZZZ
MKPYYPNTGDMHDIIPRSYECTDRVPIRNGLALLVMRSTVGKQHWCVIDQARYTCFQTKDAAMRYCEDRRMSPYPRTAANKVRRPV